MRGETLFSIPILSLITLFGITIQTPALATQSAGPEGLLCRQQTEQQEKLNHLPTNMLTALSHVESGRWDTARQEKNAWPWTVTAEGRGKFFSSKQEAISEVVRLRSRGVRNIDVGCMQINLYYHPDAFPSLDAAFDPATNVAYAVAFLKALKLETGSWSRAALRYHSATPEYAQRYAGILNRELTALNEKTRPSASASNQPQTVFYARQDGRPSAPRSLSSPYSPTQRTTIIAQSDTIKQVKTETARQREAAKTFADDWRAQQMEKWKVTKAAQTANAS